MNAFAPQTPLEQALLDAQEERLTQMEFLEQFMNAHVVILADHPATESGEWQPDTRPLILGVPNGWPALAMFSHPDRVNALPAELRSGHIHLLGATAGWVLQGTGSDLGLVMNPGSPVGFEMPPAELGRLKAGFGIGSGPGSEG